jgi:hypothetical protein
MEPVTGTRSPGYSRDPEETRVGMGNYLSGSNIGFEMDNLESRNHSAVQREVVNKSTRWIITYESFHPFLKLIGV